MLELLKGNEFISQYFTWNPTLVPNWTGHIILMLGQMIFPAFIAEKILLVIYVLGLPVSFRFFLRTLDIGNWRLGSYFIFPFIYTFLFILGFYNYSLGLVLMFFFMGIWQRKKESLTWKDVFLFFLLFTFFYLTHLFVFVVFGLTIIIWNINDFIIEKFESKNSGILVQKYMKRGLFLIVSASFAIVIIVKQFLIGNEYVQQANSRFQFSELLDWLMKTRSIIVYNYSHEGKFGTILFVVFFFLALYILYSLFSSSKKKLTIRIVWFQMSIILLALFFIVPNFIGGLGGHMSVRIMIVMHMFLITWFAVQQFPKIISYSAVIISVIISLLLVLYYIRVTRSLNGDAILITQSSVKMQHNTIVLPVEKSNYWLQNHFSNYLGIEKPLVILDNYEADSYGFPLIWNAKKMPHLVLAELSNNASCINWPSGNSHSRQIDYLFIWGESSNYDECTRYIQGRISDTYDHVSQGEMSTKINIFTSKTK
ncbi:MAG: hypothetical protein ACLFVR_15120 [Thiohalospira sp.]